MSSNENDDPAQIGMRIRGANGQTANLFVVEVYGGTDKFVIDSDGDVTVAGNFTLTGSLTYTGEMAITGDTAATITLKITGASGQSADLLVVEDNNGTDYFKVGATGNATLTGNLTQTGNTSITGTLGVTQAATLPTITGPTAINGAVTLTGNLTLTGAATLPAITGPTILTGVLTGDTFDEGTATVTAGNTYIDAAHGLTITPSINKIRLTPKDNLLGRTFRITSVDATNIRITISSLDTVNHSFGWGVF